MTGILDNGTKTFLEEQRAQATAGFPEITLAEFRRRIDQQHSLYGAPYREVVKSEVQHVSTATGTFPIFLSWPNLEQQPDVLPLLLWFHGGGWTVGSAAAQDSICRYICAEAGYAVANIDYRLAPEWPFPTGPEDAYSALCWLAENAGQLGIDRNRIAVAGASAGAHLAAVVSQLARDRKGPLPNFQALYYPCVNLEENASYQSRIDFGSGEFGLSLSEVEWLRGYFLPNPRDASDTRASPILAPNFSGLPDALIVTAECDPLVDEGRHYADRLSGAGVSVEYHCAEGAIHGFAEIPGRLPQGLAALNLLVDRLRAGAAPFSSGGAETRL